MGETSIQWTDRSVNPILARNKLTGAVGHYCRKIAPECANCYASDWQPRFKMPKFQDQVKMIRDDSIEIYFEEKRLLEVLKRRKPTKWFWCDMTDMFGDWVPDEWLDKIFAAMAMTPRHTHQILTKRPAEMKDYLSDPELPVRISDLIDSEWRDNRRGEPIVSFPLPNVWLGVSAGTQKTADEYIPILLQTPAAVRWISAEPLLEHVDLSRWMNRTQGYDEQDPVYMCNKCGVTGWGGYFTHPIADTGDYDAGCDCGAGEENIIDIGSIDWVIVGGESHRSRKRARPFVLGHGKDIVRGCKEAGVSVFMKQAGSNPTNREGIPCPHIKHPKGADMSEWPEELRIREFPR